MAGVADSAVGAILEIPPQALADIKKAEAAIKSLQATSATAAQKIKGHFDNTAVSGLNAFIKKVQDAQNKLGNVKMPTIDATGFATGISQIAQAMATVDKSATTGANRIGRIADSITKLSAAQPSAQMFQEIANGIVAIGNTSQQTIQNVSQLAQSMAQLARDIRTVQNAQRAQANDTATAAQYNKLYKEQAELTRKINEIKEKGASADLRELTLLSKMQDRWREINDQIDKLNKKKQTAASTLAQTMGANRVGDAQSRTTVSGAINYAQQAKSLKELQDAYKNLKQVMATVDPKSTAWQQMNVVLQETKGKIDGIRRSMGEFQNQANRSNDTLGRLKGQLATAFSVGAIAGYITKMVQVRGEFELQNVALRAILQNKDEADRIFMQVQQMALQSPFSIMQMTTFTKQLAAYRIESEKLVGTTKMLADVSAGLGVDMGRLILAYGQVKSANYLRATEIRQFTEAGLNIAGELATYFSELQGKMVSVGDVMEMVTKRMVRFEDVEEVFKRVTSAGGLFYDMQKKQSDTLVGMTQRITDAWQIMLNDIGKSNQGLLHDGLQLVREMISHWRMLVPIIKAVGGLMATVFAVKGIYAALMGMTKMVAAIKAITGGLNAMRVAAQTANLAFSTTGIGALITLGLTLTSVFIGLNAEASKLKEALADVQKEGVSDMYNLVFQFRQLADTAKDVTKPYEERKEAMDALQRTYKDILPSEMLEIENIRKMSDGYGEAVKAIEAYSAAKTKQKMLDTIDSEYGAEINKAIDTESANFAKIGWENILPSMKDIPRDEIQGAVRNIAYTISEEVKSGKLKYQDANKRFIELFQSTFNIPDSEINKLNYKQRIQLQSMFSIYSEILQEYAKMTAEKGKITDLGLPGVTKMSKEAEKQIQTYKDMEQAVNSYKNALQGLKDIGITDVTIDRSKLDEWQVAALEAYDKAASAMGTYKLGVDEVNTALSSNMDMTEALRNVSVNTFNSILDNLEKIARATKNNSLLAWVQNTRKEVNSLDLSPVQKEIVNMIHEVERINNVNLGNFQAAIIDSTTTVADARANIQKQITLLQESLQAYQNSILAKLAPTVAMRWFLDGKTVEQVKAEIDALTQAFGKLGGGEKKSTSGGRKSTTDKELKRLQDLGKAIKDVTTKYEELRKSYDVTTSNKMIEDMYSKVFKELGSDIKLFYKDGKYDAEALIKALRILQGEVKGTTDERKKYRSELERDIDEQQVKIKLELAKDNEEKLKKQIDDMFASYELTKELKGLGVPVDLVFSLGGEPMDLDKLKKRLQNEFEAIGGKAAPENVVKMYEDSFKKIADLENKQNQQQLKNYVKYLTEAMGERAQIQIKAIQDINKIENDAMLDNFSKQQAIMQRRKKMQEDLTKFDLDQLKSSDVYISVFKDLESASKQQLQYVLNKLRELQSAFKDLSPAQVKSIANEMKKIEDALAGKDSVKNMFGSLKDAIKYARQRNDLLKEQTDLQESVDANSKMLSAAELYLTELELRRKSIQDESSEEWKEANESVLKQQDIVKQLQDYIAELEKKLAEVTEHINKGENSWKQWKAAISDIRNGASQVKDSFDAMFSGLDSMGLVNDAFRDTYESIGDILGGLDTFLSGLESIDITKPFSIITGSIKAIGGIIQTIGAAFGLGDKKKERDIQRLVKKVDELDKAYQKLEKSIESAYTISDYNAGYKDMQANLEKQKQAYQEMIALEQSKKKTDKEKVKEYQDKLDEIAEAEEELRKSRHEFYGSTNDVWSEANNWVDAWLSAYKETGDGLDALNESWDEFYENLVKKQAVSAIVGKRMQDYIDRINNVIDSNMDEYGYVDAFKEIGEDFKKDAASWNEALKKFFEYAGIGGGAGELILSDLQKGIQNITEPQAAAIEAYLNSMRGAVWRHTEQLDTLIATIQAQYGAGTENPVVTELKGIRSVLDRIDGRLASVITNEMGRGDIVRVG